MESLFVIITLVKQVVRNQQYSPGHNFSIPMTSTHSSTHAFAPSTNVLNPGLPRGSLEDIKFTAAISRSPRGGSGNSRCIELHIMLGQSSSLAGVALPNLSNSDLGKEPLCRFFDEQLPLCNESDFVLKVTGPPPPTPDCELLDAVILISLRAGTGSGISSELIISEAVVPWIH